MKQATVVMSLDALTSTDFKNEKLFQKSDDLIHAFHDGLLLFLKKHYMDGDILILLCSKDQEFWAKKIANQLKIFTKIMLVKEFVTELSSEFIYLSSGKDLKDADESKIMQNAKGVYLVRPNNKFRRTYSNKNLLGVFENKYSRLKALIKTLRVHQWSKNVLLFLPMLAAHNLSLHNILICIAGFISFSLSASFVYILNDLLDLNSDRRHSTKKFRPLAYGEFPIHLALTILPFLLIFSFIISIFLRQPFTLFLLGYLVLTTLYSFFLKKILLIDVFVLSTLYSWRILCGAVLTAIPLSPWLLAFCFFFFFGLALLKRFSELINLAQQKNQNPQGRGYFSQDLPTVLSLGVASSFLSILVLTLYLQSKDVQILYLHPDYLWGLAFVLMYWESRMWILAGRGLVDEDPVIFAIQDPISFLTAIVGGIILLLGVL